MTEQYSHNFFPFRSDCTYDVLIEKDNSSVQTSCHSTSSTETRSSICSSKDGLSCGSSSSKKSVSFDECLEEVFVIPDKSDRTTYVYRSPTIKKTVSFCPYTDIYLIPTSEMSFPTIVQEPSIASPISINHNAAYLVAMNHFQSSKLSQPKQFRKSSPYKRRNSIETDRLPQLV